MKKIKKILIVLSLILLSFSTSTAADYKQQLVIDKNFFDQISLTSSLPTTYFLNEVYYIEGTTTSNEDNIFVFLTPSKTPQSRYLNYSTTVQNHRFIIPINFSEPGSFKLGIIPGNSGESKVAEITITSENKAKNSQIDNSIPSPTIKYSNDQTIISATNNPNKIQKIVFEQNENSQSFILRPSINSFTLPFDKMQQFSEGTLYYHTETADFNTSNQSITSNWTASPTRRIYAAQHLTADIDNDSIHLNNFPEFTKRREIISFTAKALTRLRNEAYITKPDATVESIKLTTNTNSDYIEKGSTFTFKYYPQADGIFIIEINKDNGAAALNKAIYPSNVMPFIPDYLDLKDQAKTDSRISLNSFRTELLALINQERKRYNLTSVTLDSTLNNLAQNHSDDMKKRGFFGHITPEGLSPDDRRSKMNISTPVGENLANSINVQYIHAGLMRSGAHRANILNSDWTKVGIGMVLDKDNYPIVTEEFSSNPISNSDILTIKNDILNKINNLRSQNKLHIYTIDEDLNSSAQQWADIMKKNNFLDFKSPNGQTLESFIKAGSVSKTINSILIQAGQKTALLEQIAANSEMQKNKWNKIGIGISLTILGEIKTCILLSDN